MKAARLITHWLLLLHFSAPRTHAGPIQAGGPQLDGEAIACELPPTEHLRNVGGSDGAGLCVFTSIDHAARWANEPALIGFRDFMRQSPGGGYPEKVDRYVPRMAASKGLSVPAYVQHTGGDAEFLKLALKTGRYVCVTYSGRDGVFYRTPVAHMVNLVHFSERWAVIHDNNYPGRWLWLPPDEFLSRWRGFGGGWAIVLLKPGPPPIPINLDGPPAAPPVCISGQCARNVKLRWHEDATHPGYLYLFQGELQLGTFHPNAHGYRALRPDGSWSEPCDPPIPLPDGAVPNFGLDCERISNSARYHLNGREVTKREALAAFGDLADDSGKMRLTIVGDETLRQRVLRDLASHPELTAFRDRLLVQDYPPIHWAVAGVGFAPGITLQPPADARGRAPVLFRMTSYSGPNELAQALRRADPLYRPERDPDPKRLLPSSWNISNVPTPAWVLGGLLLSLLVLKRKVQP